MFAKRSHDDIKENVYVPQVANIVQPSESDGKN